jgi:hypothetical protein
MKPKQFKLLNKAFSKSSKVLNLAGDAVIFGASVTAQPELLPVGASLRGAGALMGRAGNILKK